MSSQFFTELGLESSSTESTMSWKNSISGTKLKGTGPTGSTFYNHSTIWPPVESSNQCEQATDGRLVLATIAHPRSAVAKVICSNFYGLPKAQYIKLWMTDTSNCEVLLSARTVTLIVEQQLAALKVHSQLYQLVVWKTGMIWNYALTDLPIRIWVHQSAQRKAARSLLRSRYKL